jgi:hypothetical protein
MDADYARRWLVERFFAWIQWQRRILVRWAEELPWLRATRLPRASHARTRNDHLEVIRITQQSNSVGGSVPRRVAERRLSHRKSRTACDGLAAGYSQTLPATKHCW